MKPLFASVKGPLVACVFLGSTLFAQQFSPAVPPAPASGAKLPGAPVATHPGLWIEEGPANGPALVTEALAPKLGPLQNYPADPKSLTVKTPLPAYLLDIADLANGRGFEAAKLTGYDYVVENAGQIVATAFVGVDAAGTARVTEQYVVIQNKLRLNDVALAQQEIEKVAALEQLKGGSYELRYLGIQAGVPAAFWLKSAVPGHDLVYPLDSYPTTKGIQAHKLCTPAEFVNAVRPSAQIAYNQPHAALTWFAELEMNNYFMFRFANSNGNGFSRVYQPGMRINDTMRLVLADTTTDVHSKPQPAKTYEMDSLELIGIAKHDSPVAFTTTEHQGAKTEPVTRVLTDFETKAVATLRSGADVSMQAEGSHLTIVGAIRAQASCLQCHPGYKTGDVLGALSYRLSLVSPAIPSPAAKTP